MILPLSVLLPFDPVNTHIPFNLNRHILTQESLWFVKGTDSTASSTSLTLNTHTHLFNEGII